MLEWGPPHPNTSWIRPCNRAKTQIDTAGFILGHGFKLGRPPTIIYMIVTV